MNNYFSFIPLYNNFIENFMLNANPNFVIVYIYLLKVKISNELVNLNLLSTKLNLLESDIIKALDYWQNKNLIKYNIIGNKLQINFFNNLENIETKQIKNTNYIESNIVFTDEEIEIYSQQEQIQELFRLAEKKLAKTLRYNDKKILISIYENYNMSTELLAVLFTYCVENEKTSLSYIEKIAIDWFENNIDSVEKVEAYLKMFKNDFKTIMSFYGLTRNPIKSEEEFMKKWLLDYKMPLDIINEACTRTILNTGKPSFNYTDSILEPWKNKGVKSLDDIKKIDEEFKNSINQKVLNKQNRIEEFKKNKNNINYSTKNKFINYNQENIDYDMLRKIEIMSLKEGIDK